MGHKTNQLEPGQALHDLFREVFALQAALGAIMDRVHEQAGLSTSRLKVMRALIRLGPATVPDVAARLGVSRQFVQTICNQLLSDGMLAFTPNPRHKRSQLAELTKRGKVAFNQSRQKENRIIEQVLSDVDTNRAMEACNFLAGINRTIAEIEFAVIAPTKG